MNKNVYIISHDDWSLHRKGHLDQQRHKEKVLDAIRKNLPDLVSEENLVMQRGKKTLKIPIRSLDEYRIRFNFNKEKQFGEGDGDSQIGDVIASDGEAKGAGDSGAGDQPGTDYYEADVTFDEIAAVLFEDFCLPNMQEKKKKQVQDENYNFKDIRKAGIFSNIDKKRTILEAIKRNAIGASEKKHSIIRDDLRFKTWEVEPRHESNAVVIAMMDTSGSMGTFEKYVARTFFFWMTKFLRMKYNSVELVFLAHHTSAKEVSEHDFFARGESGGTKCSSVYELALKVIQERYNSDDYNIYAMHFTDGDNLPSDNERCLKLVQQLLQVCNMFGYGEIISPYYRSNTLYNIYQKLTDPRFVAVLIKNKTEVYSALKKFFSPQKEA